MPRLLFAFLFFSILLPSCQPDQVDATTTLEGRWELSKAMRNNMETPMLEGLFYEFKADSTLQTNLMGNEAPGSYSVEDQTIRTTGIVPSLYYQITELTDSTLHLRTELQGFRFDFELIR